MKEQFIDGVWYRVVGKRSFRPSMADLDLSKIKIADYSELYLLAWNLDRDNLVIDAEAAFGLYQANWRHVHVDKMDDREWLLLLRLVEQYGPIRHKFMGKDIETVALEDLKALRGDKNAIP
jgi:hypothetical protein